MSERDPLYNPISLLENATGTVTASVAERAALSEFKSLAAVWRRELKSLDFWKIFSGIRISMFQNQIARHSENAHSLVEQLWEMSQSPNLKPVVDRAYAKACEERDRQFRNRQVL